LTNRYLYGPAVDQILARFSAAGTIGWYLSDQLGSVRDIANQNGTVLDHIKYDSFGKVIAESNPSNGDRFKFTGREYDSITGQYYYRARYYDAAVGRFSSEDPIGFAAGDPNLYGYVRNRPTLATDPSGMDATVATPFALDPNYAPYMTWLAQSATATGAGGQAPGGTVSSFLGGIWDLVTSAPSDVWTMVTNPGATLGGAWAGSVDGAAMLANAATFHQINTLDAYVDQQIALNGGAYGTANVIGHVGVYAGYLAALAAAAGVNPWLGDVQLHGAHHGMGPHIQAMLRTGAHRTTTLFRIPWPW
jgi:RHS repeat-associated protein